MNISAREIVRGIAELEVLLEVLKQDYPEDLHKIRTIEICLFILNEIADGQFSTGSSQSEKM